MLKQFGLVIILIIVSLSMRAAALSSGLKE